MTPTLRAQTVSEFTESPIETIGRLDRTRSPEVLTVDGQPRVVLLSPAVYEELARGQLADDTLTDEDVAGMRESLRQLRAGRGMTVEEAFAPVHAELLEMLRAEQGGQAE